MTPVRVEEFADHEQAARDRLEAHAQSDWPLLAAALALEADIWTKDQDLFGTGVAVWATRNIRFVEGEAVRRPPAASTTGPSTASTGRG